MAPIDWVIFILAIAAYTPLVLGITKQNDRSQTFFTWVLYLLLDCITMFSSLAEEGAYVILFGFAVGSLVMASILLYQRRIGWKLTETITASLVLICIIFWQTGGSYWAIRFGIASESIVGIYLIIRTIKNPTVKYNIVGYICFLIVSIIAMLAAKDWSVEQMGYPFCETILSVIILIPLILKWKKERK